MPYRVIIPKSVQKQLDKIPRSIRAQIIERIVALKDNARPRDCVKLKGYEDQYRIRVGDYRVWYEIRDDESVVEILRCKHRKDIYKD